MKYVALSFLILIALIATSCNKLKNFPFDYTYHTSFSLPQAIVPATTDSIPITIPTNVDSILQKNGSNASLLQSAKLTALTMTITAPPGQTFAIVRSIQIFIVTPTGDLEIAQKTNVSSTTSTLDMDVDNVELKPYLVAENMTLKVLATTNSGTTETMTVNIAMQVHFLANLLSVL
jgi:hypothetical protein